MLLSVWGHIYSIPSVGTQTEHNSHPHSSHTVCCRNKKKDSESPNHLVLNGCKSIKPFVEIHNLRSKVKHSLNLSVLFSCRKWIFWKLWKTVYCAVDLLRGSSFPIHGNEECAINWAPQGGSAQQRDWGRGGKTAQCCNLLWTIYATQAWASLEETWYL